MSITITTDVFCDGGCGGNWVHGTTGSRPRHRVARSSAKTSGWVCRSVGGRLADLCPSCAEEADDEQ